MSTKLQLGTQDSGKLLHCRVNKDDNNALHISKN